MSTRKSPVRKKAEGLYHHGDLKAALKRAALRLVSKKGARGFSLNEASRMAGVTVAAPYRHFADKDALLAELACDGCVMMTNDLLQAAAYADQPREKMLEVGMAYLRFSSNHSDYFAMIFNSGLDKRLYPQVEQAAKGAFEVILELARTAEKTFEVADQRAVAAWGLVHGLASLTADGALSTAMEAGPEFEHLRPILRNVFK